MKVLLVHNYYGSEAPSGENQVFDSETALLRRHGYDIRTYTRHSDEIRRRGAWGMVVGGAATPWNPFSARVLRSIVDEWRPDVVHVHNTFPLISPAVFYAIAPRSARVLTLHNFRLCCPAGIPLRDDQPCTDCFSGSVVPALRHACYRKSRVATIPLAVSVALHRALGTWRKQVEAFVALTEFQKSLMIRAGLPAGRVFVKPNSCAEPSKIFPYDQRADRIVFVGRLAPEKGIGDLITAWLAWGPAAPELRIIGGGPLRASLEHRTRSAAARNVRFLGHLPAADALAEIGNARLLVVPSICYEGFPMVIAEAFARATPVAVSDAGPLPHIVTDRGAGVTFRAGDPASLLRQVRRVRDDDACGGLSVAARVAFETSCSESASFTTLERIYTGAVQNRVGPAA